MQEKKKFYVYDDNYKIINVLEKPDDEIKNLGINLFLKKIFLICFLFSVGVIFLLISFNSANINKITSNYKKEITILNDSCDYWEKKYNDSLKILNLYQIAGKLLIAKENVGEPHRDSVYKFLLDCGASHPDLILAQAIQESGCGKSSLYQKTNNLFGMNYPQKRDRLVTGKHGNFAKYDNWKMSVIDRILWDYNYFGTTTPKIETYKSKISQKYSESDDYLICLEMIMKK